MGKLLPTTGTILSHTFKIFSCLFAACLLAGNGNDQNFQGGGVFSKKFSARGGGILPEVSNFDRKSRFLALLSHN